MLIAGADQPDICDLVVSMKMMNRRLLIVGSIPVWNVTLVTLGPTVGANCRRIGKLDRRRGPLADGRTEGKKVSVVEIGIVHGVYPASGSTTVAKPYVLL